MDYRQITVNNPASPIHCVWQLRGTSTEPQRVVTDARCEIILHLANPFRELRGDHWIVQSSAIVCGQITRPLLLSPAGETNTIGIRLRSWAAGAALHTTANLLTDEIVDARTVSSRLRDSITDALHDAGKDPLQAIDQLVSLLYKVSKCLEHKAVIAVSRAEKEGGRCTVDDLAHAAGVSSRPRVSD